MEFENIPKQLVKTISDNIIFGSYDLIVFIENEEDSRFWGFIFAKTSEDKKIKFIAYSKEGNQGKKEILKYKDAILDQNGKALICIDSDFDYLLNNNDINDNPFIFQTYTYSVESYSCCVKNLDTLLKEDLLINYFNFEIFFENYSNIIFELFLLDMLLKDKATKINYKNAINSQALANNGELFLKSFKIQVDKKIIELNEKFSSILDENKVIKLKSKILKNKIIKDNFIHLYINGHRIYELTREILKRLQNDTIIKEKKEFSNLKDKISVEQLSNKKKELDNKKLDIETLLKIGFKNCYNKNYCPSFNKIIDEIKELYKYKKD